jgi:23S rRNA (guanosine2251-2'-O)-methyltransferase
MRRRSSAPPTDRLLYGVNAVLETLRAAPGTVETVWVAKGARGAAPVVAEARAQGVHVEEAEQGTLDRLSGGAPHQGALARTRPFAYAAIEDLLARRPPLLVALDGITDPQNLGAILRSAEVLGAGGVVMPADRAAAVTPAVVRASAGAVAHLPVAQVVNLARALAAAKDAGYWMVGLEADGTSEFRELPPLERVVLVVGSEGAGMRRLVREACDFVVRIPTRGRVGSLNASVSAGIGLFALRERLGAGPEGPER